MSEADTSILLPESKVVVFSRDKKTLDSAGGVVSDWRFARVEIEVVEGNAQDAIETYQGMQSPDLLIVQTDTIDEDFTAQLGALAGVCDEGTAAIVIGPVNDVNLYRRLIDMGVSDYLVRPLSKEDLAEVIARSLIERLGVKGSRLVAFIGAKGGAGASALAQATAWGIADVFGQKTLFIDASGGWSVSPVGFGFEPVTTLGEAVGAAENHDDDSLKRMIFPAGEKLSVLANGGEIMLESGLSGAELERLLDVMMAKYPVVVVDLSHAAPALMYTVLAKAQQIMVVSTASVSALRLAKSLIQEIGNIRVEEDSNVDFIINMSGMTKAHEVSQKDIEKAMGIKPSAVIEYMPDVFVTCEEQGKKLLDDKAGEVIVKTKLLPLLQKTFKVDMDLAASLPKPKDDFLSNVLAKLKVK